MTEFILTLLTAGALVGTPAHAVHLDTMAALHPYLNRMNEDLPASFEERDNDFFVADDELRLRLPARLSSGERSLGVDRLGEFALRAISPKPNLPAGDVNTLAWALLRNFEFTREVADPRFAVFDRATERLFARASLPESSPAGLARHAYLGLRLIGALRGVTPRSHEVLSRAFGGWMYESVLAALRGPDGRGVSAAEQRRMVEVLAALARGPNVDRAVTRAAWTDFVARLADQYVPARETSLAREHLRTELKWASAGALAMGVLEGLTLVAFRDLVGPPVVPLSLPLTALAASGGAVAGYLAFHQGLAPARLTETREDARALLAACETSLLRDESPE